ncbi:major facilitator superfamily domain-containing protein [Truncatella angustata]|uniref:Major facilitator superfamily domain-containing protein n=1 Tax=Truncatella angustata TaxID=152316 RepID=A0A9P8UUW8_9PEZI|nr:major facilitator superfamily domain-containing protein [Truncatella angustata]KAH6658455.1 major facilitator superfamily domain-containing protein [Truncatella angustata]
MPNNDKPVVNTPVVAPAGPPTDLTAEEGLRGWLCVLGASICIFCSLGFLNAIGVFQTVYQETYLRDYTPSSISWIFALQLALMYAAGPLYGRLVDTYGPMPVLYPCSFLCVFGLCMTSLATEYYQILLAQGLVFGIGCGGVFTAATVCVGQWFIRRRGLGIGLATTGSSLGGVIFPIFLDQLIGKVGFGGALRYTALLIGILLCCSFFLVRARLPRKKWNPDAKWFDLSLFKQKRFAYYTMGAFLVNWGLFAPFDFLPSMALNSGFPPTLAFYLVSIMNASSIPGRILPPYLGDGIGHFNVLTVSALMVGASMLALWLPFGYHPSQAGIIIFALVYGVASGAFVSLMMPCVFKLGDIQTIGQRFGTFQMVQGLSFLTGLPIMGAILNSQNNTDYSGLQLFASVSCILGTSLLLVATYFVSQSHKTWKV